MNMKRDHVEKVFHAYTSNYDLSDDKIRLKAEHTLKVAANCETIAKSLSLSKEDVDLAWLIGMLHDIGRFEQIRRYHTFSDALSVDHAALGVEILFLDGKIREYLPEFTEEEFLTVAGDNRSDENEKKPTDLQILKTAIAYHSAFLLPEDMEERTRMFSQIIRDADKVDIFRVNMEFPLESVYNTTTEEVKSCGATEQVIHDSLQHSTVLRAHKKTTADNVIGHISLVYNMVYPASFQLSLEQGFLQQLMDFRNENPKTNEAMEKISAEALKYVREHAEE